MDLREETLLVARLKQGDFSAFDPIYEAYRPRLFSFLARMTGRRQLAEDLLQETWLRFSRSIEALPEDRPLAPWLFTVARNLCISERRRSMLAFNWRHKDLRNNMEPGTPESPFDLAASSSTSYLRSLICSSAEARAWSTVSSS